jgi:hypothetical protein
VQLVQLRDKSLELDPAMSRFVGREPSDCFCELSFHSDLPSAARLVPGDGDVDEALEEIALLRGRRAPRILELLVRCEVLARADQRYALLKP